jgi:hypothetical protein
VFSGTKIKIGDEEFVLPPLSLGQLRGGLLAKLQEHDDKLAAQDVFGATIIRGEVILEALRRNYPDFPEQKVFDNLDLGNTLNLWLLVLGSSGFTPGETAGAEKENPTGISVPSTGA